MATWKKVIVSGSRAHLTDVTASAYLAPANTEGFIGTASYALAAGAAGAPPIFTISASNGGTLFGASTDTLLFTGSNGLVATFTDNSTITTASFGIATNAQVTFGGVTASLSGNATTATTATSASTVANDTAATPQYLVFAPDNNGSPAAEPLYTDTGIQYVPNTNTLTLGGNLAVNGGDITTTDTTPSLFSGTANATITIGSATSTASFGGNVVIAGGLDVNGTITTIDTTNLLVADQFILLGSGSATNKPGGIIIQSSPTPGSGFAFAYDSTTDRWLMQDSGSSTSGLNAVSLTTTMATVAAQNGISSARPSDANGPIYGGATNGYGNMWIDTDGDRDIWIYV